MISVVERYLDQYFDEVDPKSFYRSIFPVGELEQKGIQVDGKYNALAVELLPVEPGKEFDVRKNVRKFIITDDLDLIEELSERDNFVIVSPISYAGRDRTSDNARFIYSLTIDLDGIESEQNLVDLFYQIENDILPKPTYIVSSGLGAHLYYVFENPIPCFTNIVSQMAEMKKDLTRRIWNKYITELYEKPQIQSLFQGFRMVGSITKNGRRTKAYTVGSKINIEYLNGFVSENSQVKEYRYKSNLTLNEAAKKYPEWYEKRIINKQPKGTWECKKDLYNWWLKRLKSEIAVGHRYYGIMCLCIYAKKCGVDYIDLCNDAYDLLDLMEKLTTDEKNHFSRSDILAALEMYNDNYITFPIESIVALTGLPITKNKRNFQKQAWHLEDCRSKKKNMKNRGQSFKRPEGRPSKADLIQEWERRNPGRTKEECMLELGVSRSTVYRHWV